MFDSAILNVFIGLIFIYLLYSLLATIILEIIATSWSLRAETLKKGIRRMLDDDSTKDDFSKEFYKHPLIKYLGEDKMKLRPGEPAYLNANNFSKVIIDLLRGDNFQPGQSNNQFIQQALNDGKTLWKTGIIINQDTLSFLKSTWADAQGDVEKFSVLLEEWFDDTMDRVSGWYKRKTQRILLRIGLVIAIIFNVNSISISKKLLDNPKLAAQIANNAAIYQQELKKNGLSIMNGTVSKSQSDSIINKTDRLIETAIDLANGGIKNTNELLGIGWKTVIKEGQIIISWNTVWIVIFTIIGWIITAFAISLGAPFWFDLLNKFMMLRTSVTKYSDEDTLKQKVTKTTTIKRVG